MKINQKGQFGPFHLSRSTTAKLSAKCELDNLNVGAFQHCFYSVSFGPAYFGTTPLRYNQQKKRCYLKKMTRNIDL
ncbi:unnamed protein product [Larinioides sclopetarius]|uniref:Uncharacterized protein n=1 Tax=Larinioides sclopetarius TaxID=280406 RepID=A0AAV2ARD1_9ARAC